MRKGKKEWVREMGEVSLGRTENPARIRDFVLSENGKLLKSFKQRCSVTCFRFLNFIAVWTQGKRGFRKTGNKYQGGEGTREVAGLQWLRKEQEVIPFWILDAG